MFYHLLKYSLIKREKNSIWDIFPDERVDINWSKVHECLHHVGRWKDTDLTLFDNIFSEQYYKINEFKETKSHETPLCQLSDLFAGMSVFCKTHYTEYTAWKTEQTPCFGFIEPGTYSKKEIYRYRLIDMLSNAFKINSLGVSLEANKCFTTPNPNNPINFWHYRPQHDRDKAPVRI